MIFCPYPALKPYSIGHLLPINSLIPCGFALSKNKISIRAKASLCSQQKKSLATYISQQHSLNNIRTAFLIRCEQTERAEVDDSVVTPDTFQSSVFYSRSKALAWLFQ
jgi:hypothetical protein